MNETDISKEAQILQVMRKVLTTIAKDTYTAPDLKHPLSSSTIEDMRACLGLITTREAEIAADAGKESKMRPRYVDEPSSSVVVNLQKTDFNKSND